MRKYFIFLLFIISGAMILFALITGVSGGIAGRVTRENSPIEYTIYLIFYFAFFIGSFLELKNRKKQNNEN